MEMMRFFFYGCKSLKTLTIKAKFVKFGKNSFYGTSNKMVVRVPKGYKSDYKKKLRKTGASRKIKMK